MSFRAYFSLFVSPLLLFIVLFSFFFCSLSFAKDSDFVINAATLEYSQDGNFIVASGSVEILYKDLSAYGDKISYYPGSNRIFTEAGFKLEYSGLAFFGKKLDFDIKNRTGRADDIKLFYEDENVYIYGKHVDIRKNKIELNQANFTTCGYDEPHYHIYAESIVFYPKDLWIVCNWASFYLGNFPSMFVPIYLYDIKAYKRGAVNTAPYPQIGSNQDYGLFVLQSFPWYRDQDLNGSVTAGFSEKKSFSAGLGVNYRANENNEGNLTINYNPKDPILTVLNHYTYLGDKITDDSKSNLKIVQSPNLRQYTLETRFSLNERLNYETVSMIPNLNLNMKKGFFNNINFDWDIYAGCITEESTGLGTLRVGGLLNASTPVAKGWMGKLISKIQIDGTLYGQGSHWAKSAFGLNLLSDWSTFLSTELGYTHFLSNSGISPFNFEIYKFSLSDRINGSFLVSEALLSFGMSADYNVTDLSPVDIDYVAKFNMHCLSFVFKYRATRQEANFNLEFI
ncbi:hypothetical protein A3J90_02275 [candidate division WOR-1 bacterium RIFOXYC2_FULL_37_10]|uniref:Organic solvent tolerance-like N-terminal domain-containing protein n=1 Tax=candidate division WOR-1 bacterium RIFOXYB2_FULL_37_13 TaxID=1802579 RepID=A0A1F4SP36_UNCSA|nr:MAG: hypothetical protein A2246_06620 [candidate division WOR-1 bacterium RIFOXYA2_FULL_37_7]OGC22170.1 MAG: hypothetical protein A2310_04965 [candidate division WOR-1 bacterium RIFOXYB2_FULL_37_13]OGC37080.1 MAG: hypothetical protein A3J90_02275 [candidate division WOR-1 bacterium RIFOXYC2_FULL_37_10]